VAVRLMLHGTHRGEFRGIAPTGRRVTMQEMVFWRIVDGRLHTIWVQADALGLREQLRAIPPG
jgi:predicted ester cyclase